MKKQIKLEDIPGVGKIIAEKLTEIGYTDPMAIAVSSPSELASIADIGEGQATKIIHSVREMLDLGFVSADKILEKKMQSIKITTGSKNLDKLLGGGVETQAITEVYGQFASGKCVGKDTSIIFTNDSNLHFEKISDAYEHYKVEYGESKFDNGFVVPLRGVKVFGLNGNSIRSATASVLYREFVPKVLEIKTKRGRILQLTKLHKLLSVNSNSMAWTPAGLLAVKDVIAVPKKVSYGEDSSMNNDDAYFLGLFVSEGCCNPLSITNTNTRIQEWLRNFIKKRFGYGVKKGTDLFLLRKCAKEILQFLVGTKAGSKFIPDQIFLSPEAARWFLKGYVDGDGYLGSEIEMTTKSKKLATQLCYLLKIFGIEATLTDKEVGGVKYYRVFVVGNDRKKLGELMGKEYKTRNSPYGYPKPIIELLKTIYKKSLGGNRGNMRKIIGKRNVKNQAYNILTNKRINAINEKTFADMVEMFVQGRDNLTEALKFAKRLEKLTKEEFKVLLKLLPFPYNSISKETGINKRTLMNYSVRGLPNVKNKSNVEKIKAALEKELNNRLKEIELGLKLCKNIYNLSWDEIEEIKEIDYNDFVYDFVVPEGHTFIGGEMPTLLHNSQLGFQLAVDVQLPKEKGGLGKKCLFIDTENTFSPNRIISIAKSVGINPEEALKNIFVARAYNSEHQIFLIDKSPEMIEEKNIGLIVIDSLTSHFRADFVGRGELASRQQKLNKHLHNLQRLADAHNLAVYVTNQVMARPDVLFGDPTAPVGGHVLAHQATYRLYFRKGRAGTKIAQLTDAANLPPGEAIFKITEKGIEDVDEKEKE